MKVLIDANVILRYLLEDNEEMALMAEQVINGDAWATPEVLAEVEYVLRDVYELPRKEIYGKFCEMGGIIDFEPRDVVLQAIKEYGQTKLDFVDCVLIAYNKLGISRVFTFDKEINRELVKSGK